MCKGCSHDELCPLEHLTSLARYFTLQAENAPVLLLVSWAERRGKWSTTHSAGMRAQLCSRASSGIHSLFLIMAHGQVKKKREGIGMLEGRQWQENIMHPLSESHFHSAENYEYIMKLTRTTDMGCGFSLSPPASPFGSSRLILYHHIICSHKSSLSSELTQSHHHVPGKHITWIFLCRGQGGRIPWLRPLQ